MNSHEPWPPGTEVQVVEQVDQTLYDCVLHRTYVVEQYVPEVDIGIVGEEFEPFYFLNLPVRDGVEHDGVAYSAPAWAVRPLLRSVGGEDSNG